MTIDLIAGEGTMSNELKSAAEGLLYSSETDAPLYTFTWKDGGGPLTGEKLLELSNSDPKAKVKEASLEDFFSTQTESCDGQSEDERQSVERFKALQNLISAQLSDVKAFRVGEVKVRYYVVGKTKAGDWTGIWTEAVET